MTQADTAIDGVKVTRVTCEFAGQVDDRSGMVTADGVFPMVVLVKTGEIAHTPIGNDGGMHRTNYLTVQRLIVPDAELSDRLVGMFRAEAAGNPPPDVPWIPTATRPVVARPLLDLLAADERPDSLPGATEPAHSADPEPEEAERDAEPTAEPDSDGFPEFVMPPPAPVPPGEVTVRQIATNDPALREFFDA